VIQIADPKFDAFIDRLATEHGIDDREALKQALLGSMLARLGSGRTDPAYPDTLDRLDVPVKRVMSLLINPVNRARLVDVIARNYFGGKRDAADAWYASHLEGMGAILGAAPKAHVKGGRGRRRHAHLYTFVKGLAWYWQHDLGRPITLAWYKDDSGKQVPVTGSGFTAFLCAAVDYIDPGERKKLPQVAREVASEIKSKKRSVHKAKRR
jgi:hypothetical protein